MTLCHRVHWRRVPDSSSLARASVHDVYCANASNFFYIMVSFPVAWSCVIAGSNPILYAYSLFTKKDKHADKWQIQYFVNQTMWSKRWVRCPTVRMVRSLCFNVLWIQILMIFFFTQSFWEIGSRRGWKIHGYSEIPCDFLSCLANHTFRRRSSSSRPLLFLSWNVFHYHPPLYIPRSFSVNYMPFLYRRIL